MSIVVFPLSIYFLGFIIFLVLKILGKWEWTGYVSPIIFLWVPLIKDSKEDLGIIFTFKGVIFSIILSFLLLIPAYFIAPKILPYFGVGFFPHIPEIKDILTHILGIAPAEEIFFRGFIQGRFSKVSKMQKEIIFPITLSNIITSFLFMLMHLIYFHPFRFLVFFPSIIFGILRDKFQSIIPSTILHGLMNVFAISTFK